MGETEFVDPINIINFLNEEMDNAKSSPNKHYECEIMLKKTSHDMSLGLDENIKIRNINDGFSPRFERRRYRTDFSVSMPKDSKYTFNRVC